MANFRSYSTETKINGRVAVSSPSAVLGRIRFFDESYTEGSILCLRGEEKVDCETLLLCPPVAVIVFCQDSALYLKELCSLGIPCIVLNEENAKYNICKNKIAVVDAERGILTLDPSIDTLEFYSSAQKRNTTHSLGCPVGKILKESKSEKITLAESYLISTSCLNKNDIFEESVTLWERLCPELLIFDVSVPKSSDCTQRAFAEQTEELFRAALYGSFAITLSDFDCESELSVAMHLLHKSFCMLEAEGREFNGYLPRGLTLSSPLWLMRPCPVTNPDFIILDLDTLLTSLFTLSANEIIKKEKVLKKELFSILERYFSSFAPRCDVYLKTEHFSNTVLLRELVRRTDVKTVFLGS